MKNLVWLLLLGVVFAVLTLPLRSQSARPARPLREELQLMKAANQKLLDQQTVTLQKLEEMQKEAEQLRIFVRRS